MSDMIPGFCGPADGRRVCVVGDAYRFVVTGETTGGAYAMWEAIVPPGGGPPPHLHRREQESFFVIAGSVTFTVAGRRFAAQAGACVHAPIGVAHAFRNETDQPARLLILVAPAGLERMFLEIGTPLGPDEEPRPPADEDIARLLAAVPEYGIEVLLP